MGSIFNVFGPSPIKPLEQHMYRVHQCVKQLYPFFEAVLNSDWELAASIKENINELENEADIIKQDLRLNLPTGLFLPVSRTDLLELLTVQDKIANKAQHIAGLTYARKMSIPSTIHQDFLPFLSCCINASRQACKAINELDELLETGFRGREVVIVEEMIKELQQLEKESDIKLASIRQQIFDIENTLSPVDIIFLYKMLEWIDDLADRAQTVGGRLQILIAR